MVTIQKPTIAKLFLASIIALYASVFPSFTVQAQTTPDPGECKIISMGFNNGGYYGLPIGNDGVPGTISLSASDFQATGLKADANNLLIDTGTNVKARMPSTLNVTTENCKNKKLTLKISGTNGYLNANKFNCCTEDFAPTADSFSFTYDVGEDNCIAYGQDVQNFLTSGAGPYALIFLPALAPTLIYGATASYVGQQLLDAHYDCKHAAVILDTATGTAVPVANAQKNLLYFQCIDNRAGVSVATRCNEGNITNSGDDGWRRTGFTNVSFYNIAGEQITGTETDYNTDSPCYDATLNNGTGGYKPGCNALLAPLPGLTFVDSNMGVGQYINIIIRVAIGILTAIAVVVFIVIGIQYMTVGSVTGKIDARKKMLNVLLGLLVALGMFVILSTINPNLLNLEPNIEDVSLTALGDDNAPDIVPGQGGSKSLNEIAQITGIYCPQTGGKAELPKIIASVQQNASKFMYSQPGRGKVCSDNGKLCTDCSFTTTQIILKCAGINTVKGTRTVNIFKPGNNQMTAITKDSIKRQGSDIYVNNTKLEVGDLLGWSINDNGVAGHIVMYAGNGKSIESYGPDGNQNTILTTNIDGLYWKSENRYWFKWFIRP